MKALSLWQPWASLVAWEVKRTETRSWPAPPSLIGQRLAIYAALKGGEPLPIAVAQIARAELGRGPLPRGCIVATVTLTRCEQIDGRVRRLAAEDPNPLEVHLGDYRNGRYAWHLDDVHRLDNPIPTRGRQRLWNLPPELASVLA